MPISISRTHMTLHAYNSPPDTRDVRISMRNIFPFKWSTRLMLLSAKHYNDVTMGAIASQITSLTIVYSTVYSDADQRKHQSSVSLALCEGIHRWPVNSAHKGPVTRKIFPFHDVIMDNLSVTWNLQNIKYFAFHIESIWCVCVLGIHTT